MSEKLDIRAAEESLAAQAQEHARESSR